MESWPDGNRIEVKREDGERGIHPTVAPRGSSGLAGMRERAQLVGGTLWLDSTPGNGGRVHAPLPGPDVAR